ncbi:CPBP family intramembrane glutamic endopeptidase [Streptomyces sp. CRN 30]|uniref:CPBP family intramembrane glutamic endopeptidase n=1 Tax=Streptomyces sp. CRN 30 TaxID=3075613 RepID=UPI002A7FEB22|nr:CPBP family intramembrane glutamic endopeptidase [Streptomyces sp. CRN 30]
MHVQALDPAEPAEAGESAQSGEKRRRAARGALRTFFVWLVVLTGIPHAFAITTGQQMPWLMLGMFAPGAASIVTRLVRREGFKDITWRLRPASVRRAIAVGAVYPAAIAVVTYVIGWSTHLVRLVESPAVLGIELPGPPALQVTLAVLLVWLLGGLYGVLSSLGEELGWRGYMLTRLVQAEVPRPVLVTGLIWALWHMPIILGGVYLNGTGGSTPVIALLFLLSILLQNEVICRLRLTSGSVWPAVAYHAVWNAVIQAALDPATTGAHAWFLVGEQGVVLLAVNLTGVWLLTRSRSTGLSARPRTDRFGGRGGIGGPDGTSGTPW